MCLRDGLWRILRVSLMKMAICVSQYFFEERPSRHHLEYTRTRCVCIFVDLTCFRPIPSILLWQWHFIWKHLITFIEKTFNHKSPTFFPDFKETVGYLDVYFDNVGGDMLDFMLTRLNKDARIVLCGVSSFTKFSSRTIRRHFYI